MLPQQLLSLPACLNLVLVKISSSRDGVTWEFLEV